VLIIGEAELQSGTFKVKNLKTSVEQTASLEEIIKTFSKN
jgi:histidyl-tRNA synthetase